MSMWQELKRRNVIKVCIAYTILSWLIIQVIDVILPAFGAPEWMLPFIIILLGVGFVIVAFVAWAFEITPEGIKPTKTIEPEESITHVTGQKLNTIVTTLIALVLVFVVIDQYIFEDNTTEQNTANEEPLSLVTEPVVIEEVVSTVLPNSIAVLPFDNLSPDPDNAYFALGIHEEILNSLTQLRALNVIARTSMMLYADSDLSVPEIGQELNVETVMEGSIRYANDRVRVTTQLIDVESGAHLWSDVYERPFDDIFAIQSDIAMNVANAMDAEFSDEEQILISTPATSSTAAYALYLQALTVGNTTGDFIDLIDQALVLDPNFTEAHGAKAYGLSQQLVNTAGSTAGDWETVEAQLRENAAAAMTVDPFEQFANSALASLEVFSWRWTEAVEAHNRYYERAGRPLDLHPWFYSWQGKHEDSVRYAREIIGQSPIEWFPHWMLGWSFLYRGNYNEAVDSFNNALIFSPANPLIHALMAQAETGRRNIDAAAESLQLTEQLLGEDRSIVYTLDLAYAYSLIGYREDADRIIEEILMTAETEDIGTGGWAMLYLAVGDEELALTWLEAGAENARNKIIDPSLYTLMNLKLNFNNNPVLEQPEFIAVREQLTGF